MSAAEAVTGLAKTEGVLGVVIFDDAGNCLMNELPPPYEPILLGEVIKKLSATFDVLSSLEGGDATSFSVDSEDGCLVVRRAEHRWILALASLEANLNLLNVAMNVVALNLSRNGASSGTRPAAPKANTDSLRGMGSVGSMAALSTSHDSSRGMSEEIPPDAVSRSALQRLLAVYTDFLGPAAKPVLKQQLAALGVTSRTLRHSQFSDFLAKLNSKIPTAERQREFLLAVQKLRERSLL